MPTLNTIPAQTGELVRALITVGNGYDGASHAIWWDPDNSVGSISDDSDISVGAPVNDLDYIRWQLNNQITIRSTAGGSADFGGQVESGGLFAGKHILIAVDDTAPPIDLDLSIDDLAQTSASAAMRVLPTSADDIAKLDGILTGALINFVISDPPSDDPAVLHDIAASFALGAPSLSAVLGKTLPEDHDIASDFSLGAPEFSVRLDKTIAGAIDIAAGFTLGAPSFSTVLDKTTVPPHDDAASFVLGAPEFSAVLGKLGIADHDSTVAFTLGAPSFSAALVLEDATTQDRAASFNLGAPEFSVALDKQIIGVRDIAADFPLGVPSFGVVLAKRTPSERTGPIATSLSTGIAQIKQTLLAGGLLRSVQWQRRTGEKDERGRQAVKVSLLDVLIEDRPALDRSTIDTDRNDNTVLTILDPVAVTDTDTFRWGDHTYKVKEIDGVMQNAASGIRFTSEVTVIR